MVGAKNNRNVAFTKVVQRTIVLGIIIGVVIGGTILLSIPDSQSENLTLLVGRENEGDQEQSMEYMAYTGSNHTRICKVTDFSKKPIIWFKGYGDEIYVNHHDNGFKASGTGYSIMIQMYFHILIDVYENVTFTIGVPEVHGTVRIMTQMRFVDSSISYSETVVLEDGYNSDVVIQESFAPLRENSNSWIIEAEFALMISQEAGSISVDSLSIDIDSLDIVYPFQVQFYDQSGINIYDEGGSYQGNINPLLNITGDSLNHSVSNEIALVTGRANNGTVYLPEGNYTFGFGWGPYWSPEIIDSFSVEMTPGTAIKTDISLMTAKLFIEMEQRLEGWITIKDISVEWEVNIHNDVLPHDFFIYMPADTGQIEVTILPFYLKNSQESTILFDIEGTNDYTIRAHFPIFTFFIFGFDSAQLLLTIIIIGTLIASFVSLHRLFDREPIRNMISHQEFIPFILVLVGNLTPWLISDTMTFDGNVGTYQFELLIIPLGVALVGGTDRLITFIPSDLLGVTTIQWAFWIAIVIIFLRMARLLNTESKLGHYAPYLVMALFGVATMGGTTGYEVSIGPFFQVASLLVMILLRSRYGEHLMKKLKRNGD
ncbi:MAG: hypothetical protein RTV72_10815 [Candidatus Thorarchaeota archaeon]